MLKVLPAQPGMVEDICHLHHGPHTTEEDRHRLRRDHTFLFESPWGHFGRAPGYVLASEHGIHGFLGALYGRRTLGGQPRIVGNLTYWMVQENHRAMSLRLLMPFLAESDLVLTSLTPSAPASAVYQRLAFRTLETGVRIVPNLPLPHRYRWRTRVLTDPTAIQAAADPTTASLCADHANCRAWHLLVTDGTTPCYVLYTLTHKRRQRMAYLHHVGNPEAFHRYLEVIKLALLRRHGFLFLAADERLFGQQHLPLLSVRFTLPHARLFRGDGVEPSDLDSAYTELIALGSFERYFY